MWLLTLLIISILLLPAVAGDRKHQVSAWSCLQVVMNRSGAALQVVPAFAHEVDPLIVGVNQTSLRGNAAKSPQGWQIRIRDHGCFVCADLMVGRASRNARSFRR